MIPALLFLGCSTPVPPAGPPVVHLPIACGLDEDCWIVNRPDVLAGTEFRDHSGGSHTYDDHGGTDLAMANAGAAMATWVVSPVAGVVTAVRDGEPDGTFIASGRDALNHRECGNGGVIDAGGGWTVQLCHLLSGTVAVHVGQVVEVGTRWGRVGWSGWADFPHVHLTVRHDSRDVDPFTGRYRDDGSVAAPGPLWADPLPPSAQTGGLAWIGFDAGPPPTEGWAIDGGRALIPEWAPGLTLEAFVWRPQAGDTVHVEITRPDGTTTRSDIVHPRDRPRKTWTVKKSWPPDERPIGLWTARVVWERGGRERVLTTSTVLK